ncbi:hypothetical protein THAOC_13038 [Thalassiosira oceanica]|uniref:Uncharacterized protein n=1 Tax=Thalassiosira oceanica TaxID=159749 RepID=K0SL43_THAOC|nr:hypothetical protein THAOC_13038 [Thalassiosira oceanica]|eukprot:EJK66060.1 hypothetical protein THAOC_13038 [Thalassiosira oceanica]
MIEQTTRAEAASGPDGYDNGHGSEPPPHDCFKPPPAVGKPSFAYFRTPVDYLLDDVWRPDEPSACEKEISPMQRRTKYPKTLAPSAGNPRIGAVTLHKRRALDSLIGSTYRR